jgi:hypothetical protein
VRLSKEFLELVVLGFKLSKLGSVGRLHAAKAGAPLVKGGLAKATGPAKLLDGHARVSLFEEANDLLIGKSGLFHSRYSPKLADFVPSLWYGREGAGQFKCESVRTLNLKQVKPNLFGCSKPWGGAGKKKSSTADQTIGSRVLTM